MVVVLQSDLSDDLSGRKFKFASFLPLKSYAYVWQLFRGSKKLNKRSLKWRTSTNEFLWIIGICIIYTQKWCRNVDSYFMLFESIQIVTLRCHKIVQEFLSHFFIFVKIISLVFIVCWLVSWKVSSSGLYASYDEGSLNSIARTSSPNIRLSNQIRHCTHVEGEIPYSRWHVSWGQ